ncbi:hypothetical protein, partial [Bifidobacterium aquikefiri]|uniref:hypothetical protein n=1 Tax=Bifidobacterium aquikefiri TaxID=1653207 RepID=UPI0039EB3B54
SRAERSEVEGSHPTGCQQRRSLDYGYASARDDRKKKTLGMMEKERARDDEKKSTHETTEKMHTLDDGESALSG